MVDLAFSSKTRGGRVDGGGGGSGGKEFDVCRGGPNASWSRALLVDEEELALLVEEYALPLEPPQSQWDDLVDESNRYFKRQYKEVQHRQASSEDHASWQMNPAAANPCVGGAATRRITSLFEMSAAVVGTYFTAELRDCLPDDVLAAVQRHMTKERQIECLHEYKRWADNDDVVAPSMTAASSPLTKLVKRCPYDAFGRKHGEAVEWRPASGALWRTTRFEFGLRTGDHVEYFGDGVTRALEVQYREERVHGHVKWWYESGQLAGQQTFVNGLKHGAGHVWREDGSLWRSKNYRDDRKHGFCRTFDEVGRVVKSSRYDGGRKRKAGSAQLTTSCPGVTASLAATTTGSTSSWEASLIARV
jgi:hypothetical protein